MLSISSVSKAEKNKLHTDSAFIILLDIIPRELYDNDTYSTSEDVIRICHNTENITWNNQIYQAFPFNLEDIEEDSNGSEPSFNLTVDNTSRSLQGYIEDYNGGNGFIIILRVVNTKALDEDADLEEMFSVKHTVCDQDKITFTIGSSYPMASRRPLDRFMKNNCPYVYKGIRCGYNGTLTTCTHTLTDCRKHSNSKRFGGYPGIDQKGVYLND